MRISDWSSDVCSSDLTCAQRFQAFGDEAQLAARLGHLRRSARTCDAAQLLHFLFELGDLLFHRRELSTMCGSRGLNRAHLLADRLFRRSEEHTSELQSLMRISYAVFCLKKTNKHEHKHKLL